MYARMCVYIFVYIYIYRHKKDFGYSMLKLNSMLIWKENNYYLDLLCDLKEEIPKKKGFFVYDMTKNTNQHLCLKKVRN